MATPRRAARVLLLDAQDRLLLMRWTHPQGGSWWITPGGGLEDDETFLAGAVRELFEETGLTLEQSALSGPVFERTTELETEHGLLTQYEQFFLAHVVAHQVDTSGFTAFEVETMGETRWWTRAELADPAERLSPSELLELLP